MCYVYTDDGVYLVRQLLKQIQLRLPDYFYRCHSSYIVNLRYVLYLSSSKITLTDSSEIPISAKRYAQISADIEKWMNTQKKRRRRIGEEVGEGHFLLFCSGGLVN